jgi:putative lipoprotein
VAALAGVLGTPLGAAGAQAVVRGQASYRERIALVPGAVFEATLIDVSRADASAEVIGRVRVEAPGSLLIRFDIPYDAAKIDERRSYAVRAQILAGARLLFTTDKAYPVLTRGAGTDVDLLLVRVNARGTPDSAQPPTAELEDTHWTLIELDGKPVPSNLPQEPHLVFQAQPRRVSGSGGCNRLTTDYRRDGERLGFETIARTRRACIGGGMDTEDAFLRALQNVRAFRISGQRLELVDEAGRALAVFRAETGAAAKGK